MIIIIIIIISLGYHNVYYYVYYYNEPTETYNMQYICTNFGYNFESETCSSIVSVIEFHELYLYYGCYEELEVPVNLCT